MGLKEKAHLPYCNAVLHEVMRIRPNGPLALPHATTCDTTIGERGRGPVQLKTSKLPLSLGTESESALSLFCSTKKEKQSLSHEVGPQNIYRFGAARCTHGCIDFSFRRIPIIDVTAIRQNRVYENFCLSQVSTGCRRARRSGPTRTRCTTTRAAGPTRTSSTPSAGSTPADTSTANLMAPTAATHPFQVREYDLRKNLHTPLDSRTQQDSFSIAVAAGRRICLGEFLAKNELHLLTALFYQKFRVAAPPGVTLSADYTDSAFAMLSKPFKLIIETRD